MRQVTFATNWLIIIIKKIITMIKLAWFILEVWVGGLDVVVSSVTSEGR